MSEPEHISSILCRALKALAEEWKKQSEEKEVRLDADSQGDFDET